MRSVTSLATKLGEQCLRSSTVIMPILDPGLLTNFDLANCFAVYLSFERLISGSGTCVLPHLGSWFERLHGHCDKS